MRAMAGLVVGCVVLFGGWGSAACRAWGEPPDKEADAAAMRKAERLKSMEALVSAVKLQTVDKSGNTPVELVKGARFRYANPTTPCYDATLWIWGAHGRPAATISIAAERADRSSPSYWAYELTTLSPSRLRAEGADWMWTPSGAGLKFHAFKDGPTPAKSEAGRLREMKAFTRRFDGYGLYGANGKRRIAMRVLPTPIHRYKDAGHGITDGTVFMLSGDTDPEILLMIELAQGADGKPQWQYALNRISSGGLHVQLDGKEVWSCENLPDLDRNSPYFNFHRPMKKELGDE